LHSKRYYGFAIAKIRSPAHLYKNISRVAIRDLLRVSKKNKIYYYSGLCPLLNSKY
jgi:hypothetical protein